MRTMATLCILLIALPAWAGTWRDDFEDGNLNGWVPVGDAKWEVVDGRCKVSIAAGDDLFALLMIGELGWSDYSVEMEFQPNQPTTWIGLSVRVRDPQNCYIWAVDCTDKTVHWITIVEDQINIITENPVAVGPEKHTLKAAVKGSQLQGYYDGIHIRTVQLQDFRTGKAGILVGSVY